MLKIFPLILFTALGTAAVAPVSYARTDDDKKSRAQEKREKREAREEAKKEAEKKKDEERRAKRALEGNPLHEDMEEEITALSQVEAALRTVTDATVAKKVVEDYSKVFTKLPPLLRGTEAELQQLAAAQNRVSAQMWVLKKQPFFEEAGLQGLWTLITDPFSRRRAVNRQRR